MASPADAARAAAPRRAVARRRRSAAGRAGVARVTRYAGALALAGVGVAHLQQYSADSYSAIPTIGTLFLLNFAGATLTALGLVAPVRRLAGRWADQILAALAAGGIVIAVTSLGGLLLSEHGSLFGFSEHGYRGAIVLSIGLEVAAALLLSAFLTADGTGGEGANCR